MDVKCMGIKLMEHPTNDSYNRYLFTFDSYYGEIKGMTIESPRKTEYQVGKEYTVTIKSMV